MKILNLVALIISGFIIGVLLGVLLMFLVCSANDASCKFFLIAIPTWALFGAIGFPIFYMILKRIWFGSESNRIQREKKALSALLSFPAKQKRKPKRSNI